VNAVLVAAAVLSSAPARAQDKASQDKPAEASVAPATLPSNPPSAVLGSAPSDKSAPQLEAKAEGNASLATTEELVWAGHELYASGQYEGAISAYRRAYEITHQPALLFNSAQALRKLGRCKEARSQFQRYVETTDSVAPEATGWLDALERECSASSVAAPGVVPKLAPAVVAPVQQPLRVVQEPPYWTTSRVIGLGAVIAGAGAAVTALLLDNAARSKQLSAQVQPTQNAFSDHEWEDRQKARNYGIGATVAAAGALGLLAAGSFFVLFVPFDAEDNNVALGVSPVGATLTWRKSL
jgi:tetratricopeptide (TPR) repeat protein